jgi:hypothetical protein
MHASVTRCMVVYEWGRLHAAHATKAARATHLTESGYAGYTRRNATYKDTILTHVQYAYRLHSHIMPSERTYGWDTHTL